jgi:TRAP-type mannitol/chloroaromatic compound transport system permease small subunit
MEILLKLARRIDRLNESVGRPVAWLILLAVMIAVLTAFARKAGTGSNAFIEIQWYLFAAIFLLGAGHTLKRDEHVRIDVVAKHFSPLTRMCIELGGHLLFLLPLCGLMIWLGTENAWVAWRGHEMSADAGGLPRWPVLALIPLGFLLLGLQVVAESIHRMARLTGRESGDGH